MLKIQIFATLTLLASSFGIAQAQAAQSHLTVYAYPPSVKLNWETPRSLMIDFGRAVGAAALARGEKSTFVSDFGEPGTISRNYKSSMGHAISHVQCQLPNGDAYNKWVSFTGQIDNSVTAKALLQDKLGMGYLLYPFPDGYLVSGEENRLRLVHYKGPSLGGDQASGGRVRPRYIRFSIDSEQCQKLQSMITFFESFHFPPGTKYSELANKNPEEVLYFTGSIDPHVSYHERLRTGRGRVGGGCAQFAAALVREVGVFDPQYQSWIRTMDISEKLIGGELPNRQGKGQPVSLAKLLFGPMGGQWTHPGEPFQRLGGADPELIWNFIGQTQQCLSVAPEGACQSDLKSWLQKMGSKVSSGPAHILRDETSQDSQSIEGLLVNSSPSY